MRQKTAQAAPGGTARRSRVPWGLPALQKRFLHDTTRPLNVGVWQKRTKLRATALSCRARDRRGAERLALS